jgi:sulfoxide reductase heme-binding subunit YedZ
VFAFLPLLWLYAAVTQDRLGGEPLQAIEHYLGMGALRLLLLCLCITPLAKALKNGRLLRLRRPLGLWCFAWASCHFAVWIVFDLQFFWHLIGEEIVKRNYILVGFSAWLILLVLAVTSIPKILRSMGSAWKKLHHWIYLVAILAPLHFLWSVKSGVIEPLIYFAIALILLFFRRNILLRPFRSKVLT